MLLTKNIIKLNNLLVKIPGQTKKSLGYSPKIVGDLDFKKARLIFF